MRWDRDHESPDVIDRRGDSSAAVGRGIFYLLPLLIRHPIGWVILLVLGAFWLFGGQLQGLLHGGGVQGGRAKSVDERKAFVAFVLDDTQATWERKFAERGRRYTHAKLVLFSDSTPTACGYGDAATGPFYCPSDERVYIDLGFYDELAQRFGAKGDFAQAYVVAHEIGHHVQHLLGIDAKTQRGAVRGASGASVRLELQADCLAGVWARSSAQHGVLEPGDMEQAITAAAAIGDDRLQRSAGRAVHPETFTHGTSEQRVRWLRAGYDGGTIESCDTFSAQSL
jgi:predicted metalloprotease